MTRLFALMALLALSLISSAQATSMICTDSGKSSKVSFDPATKSMKTSQGGDFKVTAVEGLLVSGTTANDGPTFRARFEGQKRLEYYYHGKLMQTLLCH